MNNDDNLDLLDLDDDVGLDNIPSDSPFATARPKKPWLLMGVGVLVIILATYIIVRTIGSDNSSQIEIDLEVPEIVSTDTTAAAPTDVPATANVPAAPAPVVVAPAIAPVVQVNPGTPQRVVSDRKEVVFKPSAVPKKAETNTIKPKPKPVARAQVSGGYYVQFGSYSTRAAAESAQRKIGSAHSGLFADKQFVILAAVLPNGTTTYRLRVAFASQKQAHGFCQNAKSDGLDCYVAK